MERRYVEKDGKLDVLKSGGSLRWKKIFEESKRGKQTEVRETVKKMGKEPNLRPHQ